MTRQLASNGTVRVGRVYGIDVAPAPGIELPGVSLEERAGPLPGVTRLAHALPAEIEASWNPHHAERERELRHPDGDVVFAVDRLDGVGFMIDAPHHGRFLVRSGGEEVLFTPRAGNRTGALGVLLGQVLPLAATLRGLEILHAGAVAIDGRAAVFCATAGSGKSNLIARLVAAGAALVADDAVAIRTPPCGPPIAHAGPGTIHLLPEDAALLAAHDRLSEVPGFRTSKMVLAAESSAAAMEIAAVYLLERTPEVPALTVGRHPASAMRLVGGTSVTAVRTPERLRRHLEMCADIIARVPVLRIGVPAEAPRDAVAAAVREDFATR